MKRGGSVRDQKQNKLNEERLEKERMRMKVANDNAKIWFGEIKKMLEQEDTELILDGLTNVAIAKSAAKDKKLIRILYSKWMQKKGREIHMNDMRVEKSDFVAFIKMFKDISIQQNVIDDMFLTFAKRLGQPKPEPQALKRGQTLNATDGKLGSTLGNSLGKSQTLKGVSKGLGVSPGNHQRQPSLNLDDKDEVPAEIIKVDLSAVDSSFEKFYKTEESLSGFLNIKVIKQKFADFRKKLDVWKKVGRQRRKNKTNFKNRSAALIAAFKKAKQDFTYDN